MGLLNSSYHGLTLDGEALPDRALPHAPELAGFAVGHAAWAAKVCSYAPI